MRLKTTHLSANEKIISFVNSGYLIFNKIKADYKSKKELDSYSKEVDFLQYEKEMNSWGNDVVCCLDEIFPTELEKNVFLNPNFPVRYSGTDDEYQGLIHNFIIYIKGLDEIRIRSIPNYTDLPIQSRLYVEDIDSFYKVRDINPSMVLGKLDNGFLNISEDTVQLAIEQILNVSFHKKDWGGEFNDLYTANLVVNGCRRSTAFLLKGNGIGKKQMTIADCGKNGDQIIRLFSVSADLFVIQFVGNISDMVIKDIEEKAASRRVNYLIMDGQDTARVLMAFGKI